MPTRTADAEWKGDLQTGQGHMRLGSGAFDGT
jgi:osmotically inducible protein OsmC